ncbi:MAG TPA: glycoside hydrolase family 71/99-like protein [Candidatus Methylacidiphilales bacterium]|nr:glycoside hydrolase family 71/99-like protein [Candidatus Methylacidiphilales bacterium]
MKSRTVVVVLGSLAVIGLLVLHTPWANRPAVPSSRGPLAQTWDEVYARMSPFHGTRQPGTDPSTLNGKVMCGYQGWFLTEGDGSGAGWVHYGHDQEFKPGDCTVDLWPDMSEASPGECYPTPFHFANGRTATLFSSYNAKTVNRHFKWMADYGIDGVFLQRFGTELRSPGQYDHLDAILDNVRRGANAHGRTWAVMYDLSGLDQGEIDSIIIKDWKRLVDRMEVTQDPSYQMQNGKPVVAVWGVGFDEHRNYTLDECARLIDFLKNDPQYGGNCVMLGVPYGWRDQNRDAVQDPQLHDVIIQANIVSPWTVGRYKTIDQFNKTIEEFAGADLTWCRQNKLGYMPVIFPGFRWHNLMIYRGQSPPFGDIDRVKGAFFKAQGNGLIALGVNMLYIAMFDEIDEGTAIFKCTNNPPVGASEFGSFDGMPSDTYLRIAGEFSGELKGKIAGKN